MPKLLGSTTPRIQTAPAAEDTLGPLVVKAAQAAGLRLFPWQRHVLDVALGENDEGKWAASQVGLIVPRQNGKGGIIEALELAWLFLTKEELILHSAHEFKTAADAYRRITALIKNVPEWAEQCKFSNTNGKEGIELDDGRALKFVARSTGSGRGFPAKKLVIDEAYDYTEAENAAMAPTLTAAENPQTWFTSTPVNQEQHHNGHILAKVRRRGIKGEANLAYFEWSMPDDLPLDRYGDEDVWAAANPSYGRTIQRRTLADDFGTMTRKVFGVEHLGIGDWPLPLDETSTVIDMGLWRYLTDPRSRIEGERAFAVDVSRGGERASIAVAGRRSDDLLHVEIVDRRNGTSWLLPRLAELADRWRPRAIVVDVKSAAGGLAVDLEKHYRTTDGRRSSTMPDILRIDYTEVCQAFALWRDKVVDEQLVRHIGQDSLTEALEGASTRTIGEAQAWDRKNTSVDLTPLVAVTNALWGFTVSAGRVIDAAANVW
ncbi:hypothetical protein [Nocardia sp. NPDC046763]|uniref:hypothetical protein n=1 Tax=Nocardia sp. NPDC046763 TaxID=3155256 RepID=UPI0033E5FDA5